MRGFLLRLGRIWLILAMAIALTALLWIGGELHRANCERADRSGCSVLPWASGHDPCGGFGSASQTPACLRSRSLEQLLNGR
jgi:hypothetical protein